MNRITTQRLEVDHTDATDQLSLNKDLEPLKIPKTEELDHKFLIVLNLEFSDRRGLGELKELKNDQLKLLCSWADSHISFDCNRDINDPLNSYRPVARALILITQNNFPNELLSVKRLLDTLEGSQKPKNV